MNAQIACAILAMALLVTLINAHKPHHNIFSHRSKASKPKTTKSKASKKTFAKDNSQISGLFGRPSFPTPARPSMMPSFKHDASPRLDPDSPNIMPTMSNKPVSPSLSPMDGPTLHTTVSKLNPTHIHSTGPTSSSLLRGSTEPSVEVADTQSFEPSDAPSDTAAKMLATTAPSSTPSSKSTSSGFDSSSSPSMTLISPTSNPTIRSNFVASAIPSLLPTSLESSTTGVFSGPSLVNELPSFHPSQSGQTNPTFTSTKIPSNSFLSSAPSPAPSSKELPSFQPSQSGRTNPALTSSNSPSDLFHFSALSTPPSASPSYTKPILVPSSYTTSSTPSLSDTAPSSRVDKTQMPTPMTRVPVESTIEPSTSPSFVVASIPSDIPETIVHIPNENIEISDIEAKCNSYTDSNLLSSSIELPYFYQVETISDNNQFLAEIERLLVAAVGKKILSCANATQRRLLEQGHVDGVLSAPEDTISENYSCSPANPAAQNCHIVEGRLSLILSVADGEDMHTFLRQLKYTAYDAIETTFETLSLGDQNLIEVIYLGTEFSTLTLFDQNALKEVDGTESKTNFRIPLIAAFSFLIVMVFIVIAIKHSKGKEGKFPEYEYERKLCGEQSATQNSAEMTLSTPNNDEVYVGSI